MGQLRVSVPRGRGQPLEPRALRGYAAAYEPRGEPALPSLWPACPRSIPPTTRNDAASVAPSVPLSPQTVARREHEPPHHHRCLAHTASPAAASVAAVGTAASTQDSLWPECLSSALSEPRSG